MDYKKLKAPKTTVPYDLSDLEKDTGNVYETIVILSKRANQIARDLKEELDQKLKNFFYADSLEEIIENKDQIEISKYYEKLPKPTILAIQEYLEGKLEWKYPEKEENKKNFRKRREN